MTLAAASLSTSAVEVHRFDDPALEARFQSLTRELRCLVCQNESLADSDADLARDLRRVIDRMLREGRSDDAIKDFMVARYGEFVLYRPRLRPGTLMLWAGPFVLAIGGLVILARHVRRQRATPDEELTLDDDEHARVASLLAPHRGGGADDG